MGGARLRRTILLAPAAARCWSGLVAPERRLWIARRRTANGTGSAERAPRSPDAMRRQEPEDDFGRGPRRNLVDQCSAYACPRRAHASGPRWAPPGGHPARKRSSPATSRCAHPASTCVRCVEQAPRNPPEKPASPTPARTRNRWSGACTPARGARSTSRLGGGGGI